MSLRYKKRKLTSQLICFMMILSMIFQPLCSMPVYAAEYETETVYQETEVTEMETAEEEIMAAETEYEEILSDETEAESSTAKEQTEAAIFATEAAEENDSEEYVTEEERTETQTAGETAGAETGKYDYVFPAVYPQEVYMAIGDEGAVYSAAAETYQPGVYAYRRAVMSQEEAVSAFINSLLKRIGKGYSISSPDNVNYYACNTLLSEAFEDLGIDIRSILGGSGWGNTSDWKQMLDAHSVGDHITFEGTNDLTFKIVAKNTTILGNSAAFYEPGTIILWVEPGETTGHLGVSLGYFNRVTDGLDPAWNGAAIQTKTVNAVREHLINTYGADRNLMYGNNSIYGLANVQFSSEYIGTDVGIRGDAYGNILQYSGPYNGIFKVDALNTTYGVSVNNFVNGKSGSTVAYVLAPEDPRPTNGYAYFTKYGEALRMPLEGASFTVYSSKANAEVHDGVTGVVGTITTDKNGKATAWLGTDYMYYAVESVTPQGHIPDPDKIWEIYLDSSVDAPTMNIGVSNTEFRSGTVKVVKKDSVTGAVLAGAEFTLYEWSESAGNYAAVGILTDNNDGTYTLSGYTPRATGTYHETDHLIYTQDNGGKFKLAETALPKAYSGTWEQTFELTEDGKAFSYMVENVPWYGTVSVKKVDADTQDMLKGAVFTLKEWSEAAGDYVAVGTLADNGDGTYELKQYIIRSSGTAVDDGKLWYTSDNQGKFQIIETEAPEDYVGGWSEAIVLTEDKQVFSYEVENTLAKGELKILKKDDRGTTLAGAEFGVYTTKEAAEAGQGSAAVIVTGTDGMGSASLAVGSYYVKELKAPENYQRDETVYGPFAVNSDPALNTVHEIINYPDSGVMRLTKTGLKVDGIVGGLNGAVFAAYTTKAAAEMGSMENSSTAAYVWTTAENGIVESMVAPGIYWVKEIQAPDGYVLDHTVYGGEDGFTVNAVDGSVTVPVNENIPFRGFVSVEKYGLNAEGKRVPLADAVFGVYDSKEAAEAGTAENTDTAVTVVTTGTGGMADTAELAAGHYWVKEIQAPSGYQLDDTVYGGDNGYKVGWDIRIRKVSAKDNIPMNGKLSVVKEGYTFSGDTAVLADAEFSVYASREDALANTNAVAVMVTGDDGTAVSTAVSAGHYWIRETKAPAGYKLDETVYGGEEGYTVGWTAEVTAVPVNVNMPGEGRLILYKEGKNANGELEPLAEAVFGIYTSREDAVKGTLENTDTAYQMVTDAEGKATSKLLACDEYYVKELKAPVGYELNETVYGVFEVGILNELVSVSVAENIPKTGVLEIEKADSRTGNLLDGAVYTVYTDADCKNKAGEISVSDGIGSIELAYGIYWMKETGVPYGYQLDENVYGPYTVGGPQGDVLVPQIKEAEQRIEITLIKHDAETGEDAQGDATLAGAVFELRAAEDIIHPDGTTGIVYAAGELAATLVTDEDGYASVQKDDEGNWLHCGKYELIEIKAPAGYVLDQTPYMVDAFYDSTRVMADFVSYDAGVIKDKVIRQPVVLHKFADDEQSPAKELAGVGFTFYLLSDVCEANGVSSYYELPMNEAGLDVEKLELEGLAVIIGENGETELFSDMNGKIRTIPLVYGEYLVVETSPDAYYHAGAPFTVVVPTVQTTDENGNEVEIHTIDYEPELPFEVAVINWAAKAYLCIEKLDAETGKPVVNANAQFQIMDSEGELVIQHYWNGKEDVETDVFTTNEEGYLRTWQELKAGEYTLYEVKSPDGYVKGEPIPFSIKTDGVMFELDGEWYPCKIGYTADGESVATVPVKNLPITVEISKSDITTGKEIKGTVLTIYEQKEDGTKGDIAVFRSEEGADIPAVWTTNGTKTVIRCLPAGDYILEETAAPTGLGYVRTEDVAFTVLETGEIQKVEMKDDYTKVHISKTDMTTGQDVVGAKLQILDAYGEVYTEWISDGTVHELEYIPVGEYTLVEVQAPTENGYVHAEDVEFEVMETGEIQKAEMKDDYTKVHISKTDITTGKDIEGAKLQILDENGEVYAEWMTDGSVYEITYMPVGSYTLVEIQAPTGNGYVHAEDVEFEVMETEEIQNVEMKDDYTKVHISKTDITTGQDVVGAKLQILDENGEVYAEWTTDGSAYEITYMPVGSYTLVEIQAPTESGYVYAEDVKFEVLETGEIQKVEMKDDHTKVQISKKDLTTGEELPGALLQVIDGQGEVIEEWVSSNEPHLIEKLSTGAYILREITAPDGYVTAEEVTFEVEETGEIQSVEMMDDITKVLIRKTDIVTGKDIIGATLTLTDVSGNAVAEWVTDGKEYYIEKLPVGTYTLTETKAPGEFGYAVAESIQFTVADTGEIQKVEMKDSYTKVEISKVDITTGQELSGAVLQVINAAGQVVEEWVSSGEPHRIEKLPAGTYILRETTAPAGYVLAKDVSFTVTSTLEIQKVSMADDYTKVEISKTDMVTGVEIEGALLTVTDSSGNIVAEWVTDGTPHRIDRLPEGIYTLTETRAPYEQGYSTAESVVFTVEATGEIQKVVMEDCKTVTEVSKKDAANGKGLSGATLAILEKETGKEICRWISGTAPQVIKGLVPMRTYILTELTPPEGYETAGNIEFTVPDSIETVTIVMYDTPTHGKIVSTTELETEEELREPSEEIILGIEDYAFWWGIAMIAVGMLILIHAFWYANKRREDED